MVIADKSEGRLRAIPGSKPVAVEFDEAKRWLAGRRSFIPWPERAADDRFLTRAIRDAETPKALGRLIHQVAEFEPADKLAEKLGWKVQPWFDGTFAFDVERAREIAKSSQLDVPMFVGKALEVTLRSAEGGRS